MAVPSPPTKIELRSRGLVTRRDYARALTPETRDALEAQRADLVLPHLITARIIALHHPMISEISPYAILAGLGTGQRAAIPWFADRDARMMFREAPATEPGPWGMLQPPAEAEALAPDAVIVPIVYGDRRGTRIGHGKGHYDRALAHLRDGGPVFTIGVAWGPQISDDPIPRDPWDVPLDAIATPDEWIDCRHVRAGESPSESASSSS
jgi:5-formyltetrahydrofolate cyclo-ligase